MAPPLSVCRAWDVVDPVPLGGGQGTACVGGEVVLKPVLDEREATWLATVLAGLPARDDIRIIRPVAARSGDWVVDGWSAWARLDGAPGGGRWRDVLDVADRFHDAVSSVPWSDAIATDHPWALGGAFAWGERAIDVPDRFAPVVEALTARRRPLDLQAQLTHSDLCNNVLFHDGLPPAVIDVSPCWRPARWSKAIVAVDSIGWFGADSEALASFADHEGVQLVIRAALFRLGSAVLLCSADPDRLAAEVTAYERIVAMLPA